MYDGPGRSTSIEETSNALVARNREPAQRQAMLGARVVLVERLVRRPGRGDQDHAVEPKLQMGLLGADQVSEMQRVEGAAEDPETQDRD